MSVEEEGGGGGGGGGSSSGVGKEELLLKWDDHHKSFFECAEDLCHQEQLIDVTLSCGDHNFPAHKLILSICSPYFRSLFSRNPCKHPIVVLKDVHFKYVKLLLMYMYRGEVSCPQEDLRGLLRTARSLQIRGLVELERKREAENQTLLTSRPSSLASNEDLFSLDDVRHRLHGQLEIQPLKMDHEPPTEGPPSEDEPPLSLKREIWEGNSETPPLPPCRTAKRSSSRDSNSSLNSAALIAAAQAAGMPPNALDPADPMASMNALLAAAQAQQQQQQQQTPPPQQQAPQRPNSNGSNPPSIPPPPLTRTPTSTSTATSTSGTNGNSQSGVDLSQAAAMANLQLYYYMQKVATAGMGNPKERKECHVCGKTLYDRSTWNRHMRIHTGEKPYPCRFCGRRFRTNYNKLGHEKKCPDRHNGTLATAPSSNGGGTPAGAPETNKATPTAVYR